MVSAFVSPDGAAVAGRAGKSLRDRCSSALEPAVQRRVEHWPLPSALPEFGDHAIGELSVGHTVYPCARMRVARTVKSPWPSLSHATSYGWQAENRMFLMRSSPPGLTTGSARCARNLRCAAFIASLAGMKRRRWSRPAPAPGAAPIASRVAVPEWQQSKKQVRLTPSGILLNISRISSSIRNAPSAKS